MPVSNNITKPDILVRFLIVYPEFSPLFETSEEIVRFEVIVEKLKCLYPTFRNITGRCDLTYPFFMIVAHTLVVDGIATKIGIFRADGIVSSSTVGSVSVSKETSPYGKDYNSYYFGSTPYGKEYLAWLSRQTGLRYVN